MKNRKIQVATIIEYRLKGKRNLMVKNVDLAQITNL